MHSTIIITTEIDSQGKVAVLANGERIGTIYHNQRFNWDAFTLSGQKVPRTTTRANAMLALAFATFKNSCLTFEIR
jgi:hypothetical protein